MTSMGPELSNRTFLFLCEGMPEFEYSKKKLNEIYITAISQLPEVYSDFEQHYRALAQEEVEKTNNDDATYYFNWLTECWGRMVKFFKDPLNRELIKQVYEDSCDLKSSYINCKSNNIVEDVKDNPYLSSFAGKNLLTYGKFLSCASINIASFICLHFENHNKKYYYKFEYLIRGKYRYFYPQINPKLLNVDMDLIDLCEKYCKPLYEYL